MTLDDIQKRIKGFSFPRLMGTQGEKEIQTKIFHELKDAKIKTIAEPFDYHFGLIRSQQRLFQIIFVFEIVFLVLWILQMIWMKNIIIGIILIFWAILVIFGIYSMLKLIHFQPIISISSVEKSKNIIGEILSKKNTEFAAPMGLVIFTAHYDSISRKYAGRSFNRFFDLMLVLGFIDIIKIPIICLFYYGSNLTTINSYLSATQVLYSSILISGLFLLINNSIQNHSDGACDNATGITTIFNLIDRINLTKYIPEWLDIRFIFCGAEELGIIGSQNYVKTHKEELSRYKKVYVINLDCITSPLTMLRLKNSNKSKRSNDILTNLIIYESKRLKIPLKIEKMNLFRGSDHQSFLNDNFEVASFCTITDRIHTKNDNINHISYQILQDIGEILYNILQLLDRNINDRIFSGE